MTSFGTGTYPATLFDWDDQSDIADIAVAQDTTDYPVGLFLFTSDKGPEEYKQKQKANFFKLYGTTPSFAKHGQPLIQAANYVTAGGLATCKRVVAEDSTLANIGLVANVSKVAAQKVDENGNPIYTDGTVETTNPVGTTPVMIQKCQVRFELRSVSIAGNEVKRFNDAFLSSAQHSKQVGEDDQYALMLLTDNGRGLSNKKFRIAPDASQAHPADYTKYIITISENGTDLENHAFTMNPDIQENERNLSLDNVARRYALQYRCKVNEAEVLAFMENVAYIAGIDYSEFKNADVLFGNNLYGVAYNSIVMDASSVNLNSLTGISFVGGSNGSFGTTPITSSIYATELLKAINGDYTDDIYDLDNFRIDAVFDADYPAVVKRAIEDLATFREDFYYFRDMGTGLTSLDMVKLANANNLKSRFCGTYHNSWDIEDPYTKKQITVTCTYSLAERFVKHFINGVARPFCGQTYEITWSTDEVIQGTVNFSPKNTPTYDQKKWFEDNRINYVSYYNDILTMETEWTSQERKTQLCWAHTVLNIQSVIRDVRTFCPKNRYKFEDGTDLENYQKAVNNILEKHASDFKAIKLVYAKDENYENNKIYYAYIYVKIRDFTQRELFKVVILQGSATLSV